MQHLIKKTDITSLELVTQINLFRNEEGNRSEIRHADLLKVIRDEFEYEIGMGKISHTPYTHSQNGQNYEMFEFTKSQATQILVRESKFVRRAIIAKLESLESQTQQIALPSKKELALMVVQLEEEKEALEARNKTLEPKAEYADKVLLSTTELTTTEVAKSLGKSAVWLNEKLVELGIQFKSPNTGSFLLYQKFANLDYAHSRTYAYYDKKNGINKTKHYLVWTEKGKAYIQKRLNPNLSYAVVNRQLTTNIA